MNITIYKESYFSSIQKKIKFLLIDENLIKKIKNLTNNYSCFKHTPKKIIIITKEDIIIILKDILKKLMIKLYLVN